jgi:hypothetical protein
MLSPRSEHNRVNYLRPCTLPHIWFTTVHLPVSPSLRIFSRTKRRVARCPYRPRNNIQDIRSVRKDTTCLVRKLWIYSHDSFAGTHCLKLIAWHRSFCSLIINHLLSEAWRVSKECTHGFIAFWCLQEVTAITKAQWIVHLILRLTNRRASVRTLNVVYMTWC